MLIKAKNSLKGAEVYDFQQKKSRRNSEFSISVNFSTIGNLKKVFSLTERSIAFHVKAL